MPNCTALTINKCSNIGHAIFSKTYLDNYGYAPIFFRCIDHINTNYVTILSFQYITESAKLTMKQ